MNPTVRCNTNGYPFITFIDGDNSAENVYFSKGAAEGVEEGTPITRELLADLQVSEYINEDGEPRVKLSRKGGNRLEIAALL